MIFYGSKTGDDMSGKSKSSEFNELSLDELVEKKKQVAELLAALEDDYRKAAITEESYKQAKGSNARKLELIKEKLEEFGVKDDGPAPAAAPAKPQISASAPTAAAAPIPAQPAPPFPHPAAGDAKPPAAAHAPSNPLSAISGIFHPSPSPSFELEIQKLDGKFAVELERIKATIDAMKETRAASEEKMQRMTESIAELRSMLFQRETALKNYDIKMEKLSEAMADIEPQKIAKDFTKRDKSAAEAEVRIEKLERKSDDVMRTINETAALIKSIGGLQNIADVDHAITRKLAKVEEIAKNVERFSEKTERMFVEVNKQLEEFTVYKVKQENTEEVVRDLVKGVDRMGIRLENCLEKKEITSFREMAGNLEKQVSLLKGALTRAAPFIEAELPKGMLLLEREKEDVEALISSVTSEYEQKKIPEADFRATIEKNRAKLEELDKKLAEAIEKFAEKSREKEQSKTEKKTNPDSGKEGSDASIASAAAAPADEKKDAPEKAEPPGLKDAEAAKVPVPLSEEPRKKGDFPPEEIHVVAKPENMPEKTDAPKNMSAATGEVLGMGVPKSGRLRSRLFEQVRKSFPSADGMKKPSGLASLSSLEARLAKDPPHGEAAQAALKHFGDGGLQNLSVSRRNENTGGYPPVAPASPKAKKEKKAEEPQAHESHENPPAKSSDFQAISSSSSPRSSAELSSIESDNDLLSELEDSFKMGLLTKEAYEHTKKLLMP